MFVFFASENAGDNTRENRAQQKRTKKERKRKKTRQRKETMGNRLEQQADPCKPLLDAYVECMKEHEGVAPEPFEPEFCEEAKSLYLDCRRKGKSSG